MLCYLNPSLDPLYNHALEEYLFLHFDELAAHDGSGEPLLLLWRNRSAVVCGCYQNLYGEVNLPLALARDIVPVRRISGGGTVYHDEGNINYTVIAPAEGMGASYRPAMARMLETLRAMGIPAEMNRTCDIALHGAKISGSAQKIAGGKLLHHGTLLYDADLAAMHGVLSPRGTYFSKAIPSSPFPTVNIRQALKMTLSSEDFLAALAENYFAGCTPLTLPAEAEAEIKLLAEKYAGFAWTYGRSPAFTLETTLQNSGKPITVRVEKGVITESSERPEHFVGKALSPELERALFFDLL